MKYLDKKFQSQFWGKNLNARKYDHPVVQTFVKQRMDYIKSVIDLSEVESAFDVGCGDGFATYYFDQEIPQVEGGDISELMLDNNPVERHKLQVIDAENLPLADNSYDLMYTWEVLHHLPNPQRAVDEMARTAKKYVLIMEPNNRNILQAAFGTVVKQERGTLRSSKKFLEGLVSNVGLKLVDSIYCGKILPNKTPEFLLPHLARLPFKSSPLTGISIAVIAQKV